MAVNAGVAAPGAIATRTRGRIASGLRCPGGPVGGAQAGAWWMLWRSSWPSWQVAVSAAHHGPEHGRDRPSPQAPTESATMKSSKDTEFRDV